MQGSGFRVKDLGYRVQGLGFKIEELRLQAYIGDRIKKLGSWVCSFGPQGLGLRI